MRRRSQLRYRLYILPKSLNLNNYIGHINNITMWARSSVWLERSADITPSNMRSFRSPKCRRNTLCTEKAEGSNPFGPTISLLHFCCSVVRKSLLVFLLSLSRFNRIRVSMWLFNKICSNNAQ